MRHLVSFVQKDNIKIKIVKQVANGVHKDGMNIIKDQQVATIVQVEKAQVAQGEHHLVNVVLVRELTTMIQVVVLVVEAEHTQDIGRQAHGGVLIVIWH